MAATAKAKRNDKPNGRLYGILGLVAIACLSLGIWYFASSQVESLKSLGYVGVFLISILDSATIILPVASWTILIPLASQLNPLALGIIAGLGSSLGELTGYFAGLSGRIIVAGKNHHRLLEGQKAAVYKYGPVAVFFFAFVPNPLFDFAGITAGAIRMPLWQFLAACLLGKTIRFILLAYAGFYILDGLGY